MIPNGLTDNFNIQVDEKCYANKEFRELRILFVGRPTISKGWDRVLDLALFFNKKDIDATILCVGFNGLDKYIPIEITHYFLGIGKIPHQELNKLYDTVDFVFIPTRHEQCSYVAIEALMHGAEIVAFESFGLRNMLDNKCAYIIDSVDNFPLHSIKKGTYARHRYLEQYTADIMINNYTESLNKFLFS